MYLKRIEVRNIKCFARLEIDFTDKQEICHWTTLFGKNGLGKSTLLQTIGAALAGPAAVRELLPVAEGWVRQKKPYGEIIAELMWTEGDALTAISKSGRPKTRSPYIIRYIVTGGKPEGLPELLPERYSYTVPTIIPWAGDGSSSQRGELKKDLKRLQQTAYAESKTGWLACGYGPFRRLSGGGQEADRILYAERISARFTTLFREDAALTNATEWLIRLHNTAREGDQHSQQALQHIKNAFAADLFPEPAILQITAREALLQVGSQEPIPLKDLSDGYRSMLALSIDLLRWIIKAFPDARDPMQCPGVVLIDELDAHLHPEWQRHIGHWLCNKFPNIQFIVATHSAFLAQVPGSERSNISGMPSDEKFLGNNIVLQDTAQGVTARSDVEPVGDLRVDQILTTTLLGLDMLYSPPVERKLKRHQVLYRKEQIGELSEEEKSEYEQLSLWREHLPMLTVSEERHFEQILRNAVNRHSEQFKEIS